MRTGTKRARHEAEQHESLSVLCGLYIYIYICNICMYIYIYTHLGGPARSAGCPVHRLSSFHAQTSRRARVGGIMGSSRQRNPRTHPPARRLRAITTGIARASIIKLAVRGPSGTVSGATAPCTPSGSRQSQDRTLQTSRRAKGRGPRKKKFGGGGGAGKMGVRVYVYVRALGFLMFWRACRSLAPCSSRP